MNDKPILLILKKIRIIRNNLQFKIIFKKLVKYFKITFNFFIWFLYIYKY